MSMIKRGVFTVAALSMASAGVAHAANVSVEYLFQLPNASPISGYENQISLHSTDSLLYALPSSDATHISAAGFAGASIIGMSQSQQVGMGYVSDPSGFSRVRAVHSWIYGHMPYGYHAFVWNGSTASGVDLHPAGFLSSYALATNGFQQVGAAINIEDGSIVNYIRPHAFLWTGTAASAVDLNPAGSVSSDAKAISGNRQGGFALVEGLPHAGIWQGTADSFVDLHPAGFDTSEVTAIDGVRCYGFAEINSVTHAMMWSGTADSAVDLHPVGSPYEDSYVTAASENGIQIGCAQLGSVTHAVMWQGSAESFVDLSASLDNVSPKVAYALGMIGNEIYGYAREDSGPHSGPWAVKWTIVPEPGSLSLLGLAGLGLLKRRR